MIRWLLRKKKAATEPSRSLRDRNEQSKGKSWEWIWWQSGRRYMPGSLPPFDDLRYRTHDFPKISEFPKIKISDLIREKRKQISYGHLNCFLLHSRRYCFIYYTVSLFFEGIVTFHPYCYLKLDMRLLFEAFVDDRELKMTYQFFP